MPPEVEERVLAKWTARVERELKVADAETERQVMIELSEGRARSLARLEGVRLDARASMGRVIEDLVGTLSKIDQEHLALSFMSVVQELTNRVGQDETVAMRYIEAMQAIVHSEGSKSFVITPPTPAAGLMPSPPAPSLRASNIIEERTKGSKKKSSD
jgi:hypothetical protein